MRRVLNWITVIVFGLICFPIVSVVDIIMLAVMALNKAIRTIFITIMGAWADDDSHKLGVFWSNMLINESYKFYVDKMYPYEVDEESDDED